MSKLYGLDPTTGAVVGSMTTDPQQHFTGPAVSDGKLFLATDRYVHAYTIGGGAPPAAPSAPPCSTTTTTTPTSAAQQPTSTPTSPTPTSKPASSTPATRRCGRRIHVALRSPSLRIVRATAYLGSRRVALRRGHALRHLAFAAPAGRTFSVRLVERTRSGRTIRATVRFRDCRQRPAPRRR